MHAHLKGAEAQRGIFSGKLFLLDLKKTDFPGGTLWYISPAVADTFIKSNQGELHMRHFSLLIALLFTGLLFGPSQSAIAQAGKEVEKGAEEVGKDTSKAAKKTEKGAEAAAKDTAKGSEKVAGASTGAGKATGKAVTKGAEKTGKSAEKGAGTASKDATKGGEKAAAATAEAGKATGKGVAKGAEKTGEGAEKGAEAVGKDTAKGVGKVFGGKKKTTDTKSTGEQK